MLWAPTPKDRNAQITEMLDYSFSQYMTHPMYEREYIIKEIPIKKGSKKTIPVLTSESVSLLTKKGESVDDVNYSNPYYVTELAS